MITSLEDLDQMVEDLYTKGTDAFIARSPTKIREDVMDYDLMPMLEDWEQNTVHNATEARDELWALKCYSLGDISFVKDINEINIFQLITFNPKLNNHEIRMVYTRLSRDEVQEMFDEREYHVLFGRPMSTIGFLRIFITSKGFVGGDIDPMDQLYIKADLSAEVGEDYP